MSASPDLPRVIREAMAKKELSYRDAAGAAGLGPSYLNRLARGMVDEPSPNSLRALAPVIDVPYTRLMELAGYL